MKKINILVIVCTFIILSVNANAQQVVTSAGDYFEGDDISWSWTLGETVTETFESGKITLTQGFQQHFSLYLSQTINIPAGWSGLSGYVNPMNKSVENMFSPHLPDFTILTSFTGFYYPVGGVNTLGNWNSQNGYSVKTESDFDLTITGTEINPPMVDLSMGWNLIPVLTPCGCKSVDVFDPIADLVIVKEVAGLKVFWPAYKIKTLEYLEPGNAYMVLMNENGGFTYPPCANDLPVYKTQERTQNHTPWNDVMQTPTSHVIAFPSEVIKMAGIQVGDFIGAFTSGGLCAGKMEVNEFISDLALVAYSYDEYSNQNNGFKSGEILRLEMYRPASNERMELEAEYNPSLPNMGLFANNGLSAVNRLKVKSLNAYTKTSLFVEAYPNPSDGNFNLIMSQWPENLQIQVIDTKGRTLKVIEPGTKLEGSACALNLSDLPQGIYYLKLIDSGITRVKKIVIN